MILLLDNYDSFSFILKDYLEQCNEQDIIKENNDDFNEIIALKFTKVLLSPGPKTPSSSGCLMQMVAHCALNEIPTLGVCLGHQAIGEYFGASLQKATIPRHGKVSQIIHNNHLLFKDIAQTFNVCRYHSLIIDKTIYSSIQIIASTYQKEIMALAHPSLPLWGVQFHPESILTEHGLQLIKNWLKYCIPSK